ncbi:MAG TPA: hypothetical protein VHW23_33000 [Kofleriaceae bacterium]|jgi:hypothetical protein|nr:hypothetical protein [Kofleriaceae bacterium]
MHRKTLFGFNRAASAVVRVITESSVYIVGFHEDRGRKYVVVRGLPGTDREHVVLRDSDPRIGDASLFELPPDQWVGKHMEIATMSSSLVTAVMAETDRAAIASVGGDSPSARHVWDPSAAETLPGIVSRPPGLPAQPAARAGLGRGTNPAIPVAAERGVGHQVVTGQPTLPGAGAPASSRDLPYPERHVVYVENIAVLLRSVVRRDRLFDDVAGDRALHDRLYHALDQCAELLTQVLRRRR